MTDVRGGDRALVIIGDFMLLNKSTGRFGLEGRNEKGQLVVDFRNDNKLYQKHISNTGARKTYLDKAGWQSQKAINGHTNQRFPKSLKRSKPINEQDYGTDRNIQLWKTNVKSTKNLDWRRIVANKEDHIAFAEKEDG